MTLPRHQHWLINARSGNGAGTRLLHSLQGIEGVAAHAINFPTLAEQVKDIPPEDLLVIAGGDGTFSAVLGLPEARDRDAACVPLGTANDFAREFSISRRFGRARYDEYPSILSELSFRRCSVWSLLADGRETPFINYASVGYEGAVVGGFAAWRSRTCLRGRLANRVAYTVYGIRYTFMRLTGLTVWDEHNKVVTCAPTTGIIITNIKSHLGIALSNSASDPGDEVIEAVSVRTVLGFLRMILSGIGLPIGLSPLASGKQLAVRDIPSGTPIQVDGETHPDLQRGEIVVSFKHSVRIASAC